MPISFFIVTAVVLKNRVTDVETSDDRILWEKDARYGIRMVNELCRMILKRIPFRDGYFVLQEAANVFECESNN